MTASTLGSLGQLEQLRPEWGTLYRNCECPHPFATPEWLLSWWPAFGSGELLAVAARDEDRLVGLAPMFIHPWNGRRQVTFAGNSVSDHLDPLLHPASADAAAAEIAATLAECRERWDVCDLQDLRADSPLARAAGGSGLRWEFEEQYWCSSIALPESAEEFHARLPHGLRRNLRRYSGKLARLGTVAFETAEGAAVCDALNCLFDLHRARWEAKENGSGMLAGRAMEVFHRRAAMRLSEAGKARFHVLRLDGRIVAVAYILAEGERSSGYLSGFDPELVAYSPGALLLEYSVAEAIRGGAREFDFLRGEEAYKRDWGAVPYRTYQLRLWHD
jgi:CelD/BcsL family acetyltransferase involved in cellulose biosynthesis